MKSVESVTSGLGEMQAGFEANEEREIEKQMAVTPDDNIVEVDMNDDGMIPAVIDAGTREIQRSSFTDEPAGSNATADEVLEKGSSF